MTWSKNVIRKQNKGQSNLNIIDELQQQKMSSSYKQPYVWSRFHRVMIQLHQLLSLNFSVPHPDNRPQPLECTLMQLQGMPMACLLAHHWSPEECSRTLWLQKLFIQHVSM